MALSLADIHRLITRRGEEYYGAEGVSQREHALQCAELAEKAGASPALITAALLHDLGHLVHEMGDDPAAEGVDDVHQFLALPFLRPLFGDDVLEPIRLHVDAKRYLCAAQPGYRGMLSFASQRSLDLQGGTMTQSAAAEFIARPYAADAVRLRQWDDLAKVPGKATPSLEHYLAIAAEATRSVPA
ncbi:phosphonate degradation HD-domain oxygenase [Chitiniphilus eburneus]|uniref:HD domain-containing protein n=1 Tax=Chitiniphilus eburneus TaxID=2571148 RepID=A0A4U0PCK3_9NEIS|nr:phosphonate degradation HD-domain oxygenase [Chitiniphilus eburneus]TJZ65441.1 HD domain-containing protein [Chitiniphilus eburneus]